MILTIQIKVVDKTYTQDNILTNESENAIDVTLAPYSYTILRITSKINLSNL